MKICILGATGNSGRRLVARALDEGHQVTAIVRDASAMAIQHASLAVRQVNYDERRQLIDAIRGHEVVINSAGYLSDTGNFNRLVARVVEAADAALGPNGRFWMFAGAALLDVPGTSLLTMDLPAIPRIFQGHRANFETVRRSGLDWSVLCPGPMIDSPDGNATDGLVLSAETWPVSRPRLARFLPLIASSLAFKQSLPRLTIYYEDAAKVILDNLEADGPFSRRRVGVALPQGMARDKPGYSTRPVSKEAIGGESNESAIPRQAKQRVSRRP